MIGYEAGIALYDFCFRISSRKGSWAGDIRIGDDFTAWPFCVSVYSKAIQMHFIDSVLYLALL